MHYKWERESEEEGGSEEKEASGAWERKKGVMHASRLILSTARVQSNSDNSIDNRISRTAAVRSRFDARIVEEMVDKPILRTSREKSFWCSDDYKVVPSTTSSTIRAWKWLLAACLRNCFVHHLLDYPSIKMTPHSCRARNTTVNRVSRLSQFDCTRTISPLPHLSLNPFCSSSSSALVSHEGHVCVCVSERACKEKKKKQKQDRIYKQSRAFWRCILIRT